MKVIVVGMVILVLTLSSVLWGKGVSKSSLDFAVKKSGRLRCNIKQSSLGPWYLRVVAEDSKKHPIFDYLYSVRKDLKTSKQDCTAWMKAVKRQRASSGEQQTTHIHGTDSPRTTHRPGK